MKCCFTSWVLSVLILTSSLAAKDASSTPPTTRRDDAKEVLQGVTIADPYRWLEDQNSPETRTWIDTQNAYTHGLLDAWPGRARVEQRATQLLKVESIRLPVERNGRYFFRKRLPTRIST